MQIVFIAGATGYLGRFLRAGYRRRGWYPSALVRERARGAPSMPTVSSRTRDEA